MLLPDAELAEPVTINGSSAEQYLREFVIPQKADDFGPASL